MADSYDIIISAVDSASEAFQSIINTVQEFGSSVTDTVNSAGSEFDSMAENVAGFQDAVSNIDNSQIEELAEELGMSTDEVERLLETGANLGSIPFNDAAAAADELEREVDEAADAMDRLGSAGDVKAADTLMSMSESVTGFMQNAANTAGSFQDSMTRVSLAAEGAGISVDEMTSAVSNMSSETGRAGSTVREAFISMTSAGITDMQTMQTVFQGASAQAFILGTDVNALADKFAGMAMKSTLSEKTLKGTGITMQELGEAMGMTGATADEVKDKWKSLDTNQRAAALGIAASMNEGKNANEEYKNSWAGLQEQVEIARGRLERIVGSVILPVLIPAMKIASDVLNGVGDVISWIMAGPLGGLVSVLGTLAGVFVIVVTGAAGLRSILAFLQLQTTLDTAATILNTAAKILNGEASGAGAIANALLGESFMASAAAAWTAAAGFLAAAWPLLVIVGVIALVVLAIYELGKAFGWWTDVSSMIDAIKAGVMRLWNAFINHPDVQAAIQAISDAWNSLTSALGEAWNALSEWLGLNTGGDFDVVRAIIDGIGAAWNAVKEPIMALVDIYSTFYGGIIQVATGHMSIQTFIMNVWNALAANIPVILNAIFNVYKTIWTAIFNTVVNLVKNIVNRVTSFMRSLVGKVYSALMGVVSSVKSAIQAWISTAVSKVQDLISKIVSPLQGLAGKISSAISGVADAFAKPFKDAWSLVEPVYNKLKDAWNFVSGTGWGGDIVDDANRQLDAHQSAEGGDSAWGGDIIVSSYSNSRDVVTTENINLSIDLQNVPSSIDTDTLLTVLTNRDVLRALVGNRDFQNMDMKYKNRLINRNRRFNGV